MAGRGGAGGGRVVRGTSGHEVQGFRVTTSRRPLPRVSSSHPHRRSFLGFPVVQETVAPSPHPTPPRRPEDQSRRRTLSIAVPRGRFCCVMSSDFFGSVRGGCVGLPVGVVQPRGRVLPSSSSSSSRFRSLRHPESSPFLTPRALGLDSVIAGSWSFNGTLYPVPPPRYGRKADTCPPEGQYIPLLDMSLS